MNAKNLRLYKIDVVLQKISTEPELRMKYTQEIIINTPLEMCVNKIYAKANLKHWQRGLNYVEHIYGTPGNFGAKTKMHFKIRKKEMTVVETITHSNLPYEWHGIYATDSMDIMQQNYFESTTDNRTKWTNVNEIVPLNRKMWFLISIMPNVFKKQSLQYMKDFKNFAENEISVIHAKSKINLGF